MIGAAALVPLLLTPCGDSAERAPSIFFAGCSRRIFPLIGGLVTTYLSWRLVFVGEVVVVAEIRAHARRMAGAAPDRRAQPASTTANVNTRRTDGGAPEVAG